LDSFMKAVELLPEHLKKHANGLKDKQVEEFRLRVGQHPTAVIAGEENDLSQALINVQDIWRCLEKATNASLHSASSQLRYGYVCYCGLRIGVCGTASVQNGEIIGFKSYTSLAIRIPREHRGVCDRAYRDLFNKEIDNTLVIAPPGGGKTTALREIIRKLSNEGKRVSLVDERNEIAAFYMGQAQFDVGSHTDILTGIDKSQAAIMLLRGMNPQIVAMDEITKAEDIDTIRDFHGCGVKILATAHASDINDMNGRRLYRELLQAEIFKNILKIKSNYGTRTYEVKKLCT